MTMLKKLTAALRQLRADETGSASVEFVVAVPLVAFWFAGSYTFFDAYANNARSLKATYTIADILSRQTEVDNDYIDDMNRLFANLAGEAESQTWLRVTSIQKDGDNYLI